jgi:hypothetical protein
VQQEEEDDEEEQVNDMAKLPLWDKLVDEMCTPGDVIKDIEKDHEEVADFFKDDPAKLMFK